MMLKTVNNEFIEIPDVDVERQAKLFQNIGDTAGDFSYEFEIDNNGENRDKLGIISPVNGFQKTIYTINDVSICDYHGSVVYSGFVRVQSITDTISLSFFSGNNNWFNLMAGEIADLDLTDLELEINTTTIPGTWANTSGIIFPLVDLGAISKRSTNSWKIDDFQPFIYVKDAVKECFTQSGLKLSGEILNDWRYNHLITTNGSENTKEIEDRKVYVNKSSTQSIAEATWDVVTFPNFTGVYYPGTLWDTSNSKFVADSKMIVDISFNAVVDVVNGPGFANYLIFHFYVNGVSKKFATYREAGLNQSVTHNDTISLEAGDELELRARRTQPLGTAAVDSGDIKIVPTRIYKVFANNILPNTTQVDFVNQVFKLFNTVIDYDPFTKTVTVDLFKNIIRRPEIDLSEYIDPSNEEINYTELIESYGNTNILKYSDPSSETIERYNRDKPYPYGSGTIESGNEFAEDNVVIVDSIFTASDVSIKNPLSINLPRMDFNEEDEGSEEEATVTNSAGALFTVDAGFKPVVNEFVNIKTSTNDVYGGQYRISSVPSPTTFRLFALSYVSNETVKITKVEISRTNNNDQILLLVEPDVTYAEFAPNFSEIDIEDDVASEDPAIAWFYRTMDGNTIDSMDKSLSFGDIPIEKAYQRTMIEDYWADLEPILQDPVKVYEDANLPKPVFESINFKQPIRIKTDQFNARFIPNRITGYKDSSQPCTLELIKLP